MYQVSDLQITEATVTEPVSLTEIKSWLQIDFTDFDTLLTDMGKGARISIEKYYGKPLVDKSVEFDLDITKEGTILLPFGRPDAITVEVLDYSDTATTLTDGEEYFLRGTTVRFTSAGRYHISYDVTASVTEDVKEAIKMEVAERFNNRGEAPTGISEAAKSKLSDRQVWL